MAFFKFRIIIIIIIIMLWWADGGRRGGAEWLLRRLRPIDKINFAV